MVLELASTLSDVFTSGTVRRRCFTQLFQDLTPRSGTRRVASPTQFGKLGMQGTKVCNLPVDLKNMLVDQIVHSAACHVRPILKT